MPSRLKVKMWKSTELPQDWFMRAASTDKQSESVEAAVQNVIDQVRKRGDDAVLEFTLKFDKIKLEKSDLRVTAEEIKLAYKAAPKDQIKALKLMKQRLAANETKTLKRQSAKTKREGVTVRTELRPIESVGCYVPGGQAAYPSTLVMTAVPAKVAEVGRVVVCTPPSVDGKVNPLTLVAADICGVNEVYKIGGVQAIAALAYGTQTVKPVSKIVGPGSKYVTEAKLQVSRDVAIDMPAGPSEVLVLADAAADPKLVSADMISQAEHGADSVAGLATTSPKLAKAVQTLLGKLAESAERKNIVQQALSSNAFIITCQNRSELAYLANTFAPEHLEIITEEPVELAKKIVTAGLILIGPFSPVALSDYASGTNHVLPTGGYGYAYSGLSVLDFTRRISIVESTEEGLRKAKPVIKALTEAEKLPNHYKAVEARFKK